MFSSLFLCLFVRHIKQWTYNVYNLKHQLNFHTEFELLANLYFSSMELQHSHNVISVFVFHMVVIHRRDRRRVGVRRLLCSAAQPQPFGCSCPAVGSWFSSSPDLLENTPTALQRFDSTPLEKEGKYVKFTLTTRHQTV